MCMITFKQFLSESRAKITTVAEFINWADKNAKGYLQGPHFFYRGGTGKNADGKILIGDSNKSGARSSANTYNNYTLWIDNHPSFKKWPKRSLSWIATDDVRVAQDDFGYGKVHLLVVKDSAQVAAVGEPDMWHVNLDIPDIDIQTLNEITASLIGKSIDNITDLVNRLKDYTIDMLKQEIEKPDEDNGEEIKSVYQYMDKHNLNTLYDLWEALVTPKIFPGHTTGANASSSESNGEVWIEGQVAFIPSDDLSEEDTHALWEWANKYPEFQEALEGIWDY